MVYFISHNPLLVCSICLTLTLSISRFAVFAQLIRGNSKYGPNGLFNQSSFPSFLVPSHLLQPLCTAANFSLTKQTWSTYRTAQNMLFKCSEETNVIFSLPLTHSDILSFTAWLLARNIKSSTISSYLSGLRQLH